MDMKIAVEKHVQEATQPAQPPIQAPNGNLPTAQDVQAMQAQVPARGMDMSPEQKSQL